MENQVEKKMGNQMENGIRYRVRPIQHIMTLVVLYTPIWDRDPWAAKVLRGFNEASPQTVKRNVYLLGKFLGLNLLKPKPLDPETYYLGICF